MNAVTTNETDPLPSYKLNVGPAGGTIQIQQWAVPVPRGRDGPFMSIKFRCVHCNQKLGIADRKAGTQVQCPTCLQMVTVPVPQAEPVSGIHSAGGAAPAPVSP